MPGIDSTEIIHQCRSAWNKETLYAILEAILNALSINYLCYQTYEY